MNALDKTLRNELSRTVLAARKLAEEAAGKALHSLGVDEADAPGHLDNDGRRLRIRLRAQAKQLGDRDAVKSGNYEIRHLSEKIAYDHWHRLLFARFLAENDLLISPDHDGVGVSLPDCEELAPTLGLRDGWEVAANFASRMLPQIFRADDPAGNVIFAPEDRVALRKLVTDLPRNIIIAADALGWVYQFWQTQQKEEANKSGNKIGADELPSVTQLFTEDYMVDFLLDNTLGAWWAGKTFTTDFTDDTDFKTEEDCRKACALPGCPWKYLRFIQGSDGKWTPAAGTFDGWPKTAKELKCLDPSMGSGHFVVAMFERLVALRMAEEKLDVETAVAAVIRDNIFGLEIDPRCTQIAAFNLALAAWRHAGYRPLPAMNLACSGLAPNTSEADWIKIAGDDGYLKNGMARLHQLFKNAPVLGSLINPSVGRDELLEAAFHELQPLLEKAQAQETKDDITHEMAVTAHGLAKAAEILGGKFTLVATNVPYLVKAKQCNDLRRFCEAYSKDASSDLATIFLDRCADFCVVGGTHCTVTPQNWLFLKSYSGFRKRLLTGSQICHVTSVGSGATATASWDVLRALAIITMKTRPEYYVTGIETDAAQEAQRSSDLKTSHLYCVSSKRLLQIPDCRVALAAASSAGLLLDRYADSLQGISTGDNPRFQFCFWEVIEFSRAWAFQQGTVPETMQYGGREKVIHWENGGGALVHNAGSAIRGLRAVGCQGIAVTQMRSLPVTIFSGSFFDTNVAVILPKDGKFFSALWAYCSSPDFLVAVRRVDKKLNVTNASFGHAPFDLAHWQKVAAEKYPQGLPTPFSSDPTQWLFNGHPAGADQPLHVAVARLLGYQWPRQTGSNFPDCPALDPDGLEKLADSDGIVYLNAIKGEQPAAERLRALLAAAFGRTWSAAKQAELLAQVGYDGKTLEEWLRNDFFEQHCQLFHHRPFVWQIWDGLRDGFSVLVNYHKLDRPTLEKLTYTYLGDWIARQKASVSAGEEGSDAKLAAALELKAALEKILEGEAPYDIFVRWKPLEKQPIGWAPDLNDGVRMNIRPFMSVPDVGKKGAGILRWKPNIKWDKDRGTDVTSAPWYKVFKGDRINDHHLSLAEKRKARES